MTSTTSYHYRHYHHQQQQAKQRSQNIGFAATIFLYFLIGTIVNYSPTTTKSSSSLFFVSGFTTKNSISHNVTKKTSSSSLLFRKPSAMFAAKDNEISSTTTSTTRSTSILLNRITGGLTFAGGLMGFLTKGSKASLIAGSTFGGLLWISTLIRNANISSMFGSVVSGMLTYTMGKKFLKSGKFVPAGLIATLGTLSFIWNILAILMTTTKSSSSSSSSSGEEGKEEKSIDEPSTETTNGDEDATASS